LPKDKSILSKYSCNFLPPLKQKSAKRLESLPIIKEQLETQIKSTKGIDKVQMISSFDASHMVMPKFTDKVEGEGNSDYNKIRHLMKSNKRMSQVLWELSLRTDKASQRKEAE